MSEFESLITFTEQERVELADDFKSLLHTRGFRRFLELLERRALNVGNASLDDETRSKDFWLGFREGATSLNEEVRQIISGGEELKAEIQRDKKASLTGFRGGSSEPDWEDSAS